MDDKSLKDLAGAFAQELQSSDPLKAHVADHQRRSQRAQVMLRAERIPSLTEDNLRELFFDTDAFSFWTNKEWTFNDRVQRVGVDTLRGTLEDLVRSGENGLAIDDLKRIWQSPTLGVLLASELLAYRFPDRYWTFSQNVTLPAFQVLGEDVKAKMPHGQKADPYLYMALEPHMRQLRTALVAAGISVVDNLLTDIFLWWIKQRPITKPVFRGWKISPGEQAWAWEEYLKRGVLAIGWGESGDLRANPSVSREGLKLRLEEAGLWSGNSAVHAASMLWAIFHEMQMGDVIFAYGKRQILGWGEIAGEYDFQADDLRYPHRRNVRWTPIEPVSVDGLSAKLQDLLKQRSTIITLSSDEVQDIQSLLADQASQTWLFQANPKVYDLEVGLRRERTIDWLVKRYRQEIHKGDRVLFWKAGESRGLYGIGRVGSDLYERADGDYVVDLINEGRLTRPVFYDDLRQHPVLSNMLIMRQQQGTNFRVTPDEWAALQPLLVEIIPPDPDAIDRRETIEPTAPVPDLLTLLRDWLAGSGLHFTDWPIASFYTALQAKGFVILSGISGTGKTKLAQKFAEMLPQPKAHEAASDVINLTVQPYMLKYGRFIIPKQATRLFDPPNAGEAKEVNLSFQGQTQSCRLVHAAYGTNDYLSLLLRGAARQWFGQHLKEGDAIVLEPELDREQNLVGFRLLTPADAPGDNRSGKSGRNWLFVSVRPDWRDGKSLLGYFNPLLRTYEWTEFLRFLVRAEHSYQAEEGLAWFVILDEMNLAHVEYYFADLLSVMESGRDEDGWSREPLRFTYPDDTDGDLPPRELRLTPNLYVIGTVNIDETTHAFSSKVLDRAFTLELTEADFSRYLLGPTKVESRFTPAQRHALVADFTFEGYYGGYGYADKQSLVDLLEKRPETRSRLQNLNDLLRPHNLHFGYRVFDEICWFLDAADNNGLYENQGGFEVAFDAAVLMKVLPKFHGSRGRLEAPLRALLAWCLDPDAPALEAIADAMSGIETNDDVRETLGQLTYIYKRTAERAQRMMWGLYADGFAAFG